MAVTHSDTKCQSHVPFC